MTRTCNQPHCNRVHYAHGLCQHHYSRWWHGKAPHDRPAKLTKRTRITYSRGGKAV
jgi:hypothetical protein